MKKHLFQRISAVCTSAALSVCALSVGSVSPMSASAADDNYAKLLQYSLYFYDANMCGAVGSKSAFEWRGDCHLGDEIKGGYHDAGDHAMFGLPQGYTASTIGWAYYEFKDAFAATGQADHFKTISKHFTDFFKASTKLSGDSVSNFLYQKGDGDVDHKYWGKPENQEQTQGVRKMFWTSNSASDIAAEYAAALALDYLNFGDAESLTYAKALYKFSTANNRCESNGPSGFYLSDYANPTDEQAWAAGWLYLATKDEFYKSECASKQTQYLGWVHGWDNVGLGAACVYAEITGDWSKPCGWMGQYTNQNGYFFLENGGEWGSARINCSMQMTALVATKHGGANYGDWVKGQMNYILGANPANTCFVCGYASNSAKNPHHRAASGYNNYDELGNNKTYSSSGHILTGALVGGPGDKNGTYSDVIDDYKCNEVALDYNAGLVGAAAGLYSIYKSGTPDTNVNGIGTVNVTPQPVETDAPVQTTAPNAQTTAPNVQTTVQPVQTTPVSGGNGSYTISPKTAFDYDKTTEDTRMIEFAWSDFGMKSGEVATKVEFNVSTNNGNLGTWVGAFGTGTSTAPDYWYMSDQQEKPLSGSSATITWEIPSDVAKTINYTRDDCPLKLGIWWIDCKQITVDSVKVYTSGSATTVVTTAPPVQTTTPPVQTTTTPVQTTPNQTTQPNSTKTATLWGDADLSNDVDISDAVLVARVSVEDKNAKIYDQGKINADVNHNGGIDSEDALKIVRRVANVITQEDLAR